MCPAATSGRHGDGVDRVRSRSVDLGWHRPCCRHRFVRLTRRRDFALTSWTVRRTWRQRRWPRSDAFTVRVFFRGVLVDDVGHSPGLAPDQLWLAATWSVGSRRYCCCCPFKNLTQVNWIITWKWLENEILVHLNVLKQLCCHLMTMSLQITFWDDVCHFWLRSGDQLVFASWHSNMPKTSKLNNNLAKMLLVNMKFNS